MLLLGQRHQAIFKSYLQKYLHFQACQQDTEHHICRSPVQISFHWKSVVPCQSVSDELMYNNISAHFTFCLLCLCHHGFFLVSMAVWQEIIWHQKEFRVAEEEKTESKMGRDTELFCCRCQRVICFKNAPSANHRSHIPKQGIWEKRPVIFYWIYAAEFVGSYPLKGKLWHSLPLIHQIKIAYFVSGCSSYACLWIFWEYSREMLKNICSFPP